MNGEILDSKLNTIFSNINDWLKFAEGKAAALIAANGALIFGILRQLKDEDCGALITVYAIIVIFQLAVSFILCLVSFIPALKIPWLFKENNTSEADNLFYFQHIANYTPLKYLSVLAKSLDLKKDSFTKYEQMLSAQIIANSVISVRKYKLFKVAIWFTLSAIATPIGAVVLYEIK